MLYNTAMFIHPLHLLPFIHSLHAPLTNRLYSVSICYLLTIFSTYSFYLMTVFTTLTVTVIFYSYFGTV